MMTSYDIIHKPVITERSMEDVANKKYVFEVAIEANKPQIAKAIEEIFGVKVKKVNIIRLPGKLKTQGRTSGYRPDRKKAVVQLTADSKSIEVFEGMV